MDIDLKINKFVNDNEKYGNYNTNLMIKFNSNFYFK